MDGSENIVTHIDIPM